MKKLIVFIAIILLGGHGYAQKTIDSKYKKPSLGNQKATTAVKMPLTRDMMVQVTGKSGSDRIFDKCQAEYNSFHQNGDEIWIYEDEFYNGKKKILKVGDYTLKGSATSHELGTDWNDKISSMLIPVSLKIDLFMDDHFSGLKTSAAGYGIINRERDDKGFKGDYFTFKDLGKYSKGGLYFYGTEISYNANDNISSLKIYKVN
jgi:hypothetical protein